MKNCLVNDDVDNAVIDQPPRQLRTSAMNPLNAVIQRISVLDESADIRPLAKVNLRASNSVFLQLNSFLNQIVFVYSYSVLLISENA